MQMCAAQWVSELQAEVICGLQDSLAENDKVIMGDGQVPEGW